MARPKTPSEFGLSAAAYAEHRKRLGLPAPSLSSVKKALKTGRITRNEHGKIDPKQADADWLAHTRPRGDREEPEAAHPPTPPESLSLDGRTPKYTESRAKREAYLAEKVRLELEELRGSLIDAAASRSTTFELARSTRDNILALSPRLAGQLAAITDPRQIEQILDAELRKAMEAISDEALSEGVS